MGNKMASVRRDQTPITTFLKVWPKSYYMQVHECFQAQFCTAVATYSRR